MAKIYLGGGGSSAPISKSPDALVANLLDHDLLAWVVADQKWENLSGIKLGLAASVIGSAVQSTSTMITGAAYAKMPVDGASILRGGATIDNTGIAGNGIKPGTAGGYLIIGQIGSTANTGTFLQAAWGANGAAQSIGIGSAGGTQNGATVVAIAQLLATDIINLMGQAATAQLSYPAACRLHVIRLW